SSLWSHIILPLANILALAKFGAALDVEPLHANIGAKNKRAQSIIRRGATKLRLSIKFFLLTDFSQCIVSYRGVLH
ncbi:hypothetical protein ACJX0J_019334, partial [Zea mays]